MDTRGNPSNLWIPYEESQLNINKLDAFNMPRTGTTLCQPKIGNVDLSVIPLSTRMEITPTLPKYQTVNEYPLPSTVQEYLVLIKYDTVSIARIKYCKYCLYSYIYF